MDMNSMREVARISLLSTWQNQKRRKNCHFRRGQGKAGMRSESWRLCQRHSAAPTSTWAPSWSHRRERGADSSCSATISEPERELWSQPLPATGHRGQRQAGHSGPTSAAGKPPRPPLPRSVTVTRTRPGRKSKPAALRIPGDLSQEGQGRFSPG